MEQVLYAQVVNLRRNDMKSIAANKNKNEAKFKFHGQSARSQRWFDIDFDCIEVNFITCEPNLYNKKILSHYDTQNTNKFKIFQVPIGNTKFMENFKFYNDAPMLKYCLKSLKSWCFTNLASAFDSIEQTKSVNAISVCIEESLKNITGNIIDFVNGILKNDK